MIRFNSKRLIFVILSTLIFIKPLFIAESIDPIKVKLPSAEPISKKLKSSFDTLVKDNKLLLTKFEYLYPSEND